MIWRKICAHSRIRAHPRNCALTAAWQHWSNISLNIFCQIAKDCCLAFSDLTNFSLKNRKKVVSTINDLTNFFLQLLMYSWKRKRWYQIHKLRLGEFIAWKEFPRKMKSDSFYIQLFNELCICLHLETEMACQIP